MTKEEKTEMYRKNRDKHIKGRKSRITALIVVPIVGAAITLLLAIAGKNRQNELEAATVLDSVSIGEFLKQNENGSAIYTGTIKAADPVSHPDEGGEYIWLHRKIEQIEKFHDDENDKYETRTTTIEDDSDSCDEIEIDDVIVPNRLFHDLPVYSKTNTEGAAINQFRTDFSYTPARVDGTFFIKCKDGEVSSARYYESTDVAGESRKGFDMARIIIWVFIVGIEIFLVVDIIKTTKAIKMIGEKCQ